MASVTPEVIFSKIDEEQDNILDSFMKMLRIPALSPVNGGKGEGEKAEFLRELLDSLHMDSIEVYTAEDVVPRPNIIAVKHGVDRTKRLWVMCHMDVVPIGDRSLWNSDPFEPMMKDGKIFARGSEDNGQELIASIFGLRILGELGIEPAMDIGLALVADEETGSTFGIRYLMDKGIFRPDDLIIVPDAGNSDATDLEIAEKSILWLKVVTKGKQCHASTPDKGNNPHYAGMKFGVKAMETLKQRYASENSLFDPPGSTFEPTKKEANVPNINTIPGVDIFFMDCRILPETDPDEVLALLNEISREVEEELGVSIELSIEKLERAAPPTPVNAPVVELLAEAVKNVWNNDPKAMGIGGGTCAAILRKAGLPAVVWGRIDDTAHAPNEYTRIENIMGSTKVYALLFSGVAQKTE